MSWQERANCGDLPPGTLFPEDPADEAGLAALHCAGCPVWAECLTAGLDQAFGVWGGMTSKERRALRRKKTT